MRSKSVLVSKAVENRLLKAGPHGPAFLCSCHLSRHKLECRAMKLSVIVPIYNEIDQLPHFFEMLSAQISIDLELIIVDGGSNDGSVEWVQQKKSGYKWSVCLVQGEKGRARQLNAGASQSFSETLLFLHIDSYFDDHQALFNGLTALESEISAQGSDRIAGHFRLKFTRSDNTSRFGYYFWECKARLDRHECTHGDQGFLLRKSFFEEVGPFDNDVPIAEDTRLAERIRAGGSWMLLPVVIWTSARRFEVEGLRERQTLNALIMNFTAIGWDVFFEQVKDVYKNQSDSEKLDMMAFFALIDRLNREASFSQRLSTWYKTGVYVRPNAWQLAFLKDIKVNFARQVPVDDVILNNLAFHDRWFDRLTNNLIGKCIAMVGTWVWYRLTVRYFSRQES